MGTTADDALSLIAAAGRLFALGRRDSARLFLDRALRIPAGERVLARDYPRAVAVGEIAFAEVGLRARIAARPGAAAEILAGTWDILLAETAGKPFDAALFQARLDRITPPVAGADPQAEQARGSDLCPDLCYVLAHGLPHDRTGYAMRSQALVTALQEAGLSVHCVTQPGFPWNRGVAPVTLRDSVGPVTYHRSGDPNQLPFHDLTSVLAAETALVRVLDRVRPRQVMAASDHANAIPALFAARRFGLPFIYEIRGFWELSRASRWPAFRDSAAFQRIRGLEAAVAAAADQVFVLSAAMRDDLIGRGVRADRIAILPNAADPVALQPQPRDPVLAARIGLPMDAVMIGYAGTFHPYEGLDDLVSACATLFGQGRDFRLLLIGKEPRSDISIAARLREMAAAAGFADRLIMPGEVPATEIAAWYSLIDIAPVPRKPLDVTELVAPLKPYEAMAMQKCVVVPDLAVLSEIVRDGETGLVYRRADPGGLAVALARLLDDPPLRHRLGRQARDWILREANWQAVAARCLSHVRASGRTAAGPRGLEHTGQPV